MKLRSPLSYNRVRVALAPLLRAWPIKKRPKPGDYLNVGCGPFPTAGFFNIDGDYHDGVQMYCDLRRPLKMDDGVIAGVFMEHCLEHFDLDDGRTLAGELYRVMAPGAVARISVPNGAFYMSAYVNGGEMPYVPKDTLPMRAVNNIFYQHGHRNIYDHATLADLLEGVGFTVELADFGAGRDPKLLLDQEGRRVESLYVEAVKLVS